MPNPPPPRHFDPDWPGGWFYRLTTMDLVERAIGWSLIGFALGWAACSLVG